MSQEIKTNTEHKETVSPNFQEVYCNSMKMRMSQWDIGMLFAQAKNDPSGNFVQEAQVAVTMSPQHFKAFVSSLNTTLAAWESQFGIVNLGPEFLRNQISEATLNQAIANATTKIAASS